MISSRPSEYFGWYFRYNTRTTYGRFTDAGLNLFASPAAQTQEDWLDLTNVLPALSGGFRRRWGISSVLTNVNTGGIGASPNPVRTFAYNAQQDASNPSGTQDTNEVVYSDGQNLYTLSDTGTTFAVGSTRLVAPGTPSLSGFAGVSSREFFYFTNGNSQLFKSQLNTTATPTTSNWGIVYPPSATANQGTMEIVGYGSGAGYTATQSVAITDAVGSGSGATASAYEEGGHFRRFTVTAVGTNYQSPVATIPAPPSGGSQAYAIAYSDLNTNNSTFGKIVALMPSGPIGLVFGRTYTYALLNSVTGHVSDVSNATATTPGNQALPVITDVVLSEPATYGSTGLPAQLGWTHIDVKITLGPNIDPQVDTVLLLATSDGGALTNLYLVAQIPKSSFTGSPLTYTYTDTLPDGYSSMYNSGATLLTNDVYQSTDGFGNNYGIAGNTPPPSPLFFPTLHQGYLFGTDGESLFFSKSIVDVTTAQGLITSKWEEAWPGDNQLPIALGNETITGLKSDGNSLHIGTTKSIYTCVGNDASNFAVPNQQFAQTGVLSNDLWTVVYAHGQPAGYIWITPDYKIMWSDFNTYEDIGQPVYPLLSDWDATFTNTAKLLAFTQGPFNFAVLCYKRSSSAQSEFLIYETTMHRWYRWIFGSPTTFLQPSETGPLCSFVYQHPSNGTRFLYFFTVDSGSTQASRIYYAPPTIPSGYKVNLYKFDPSALVDIGTTGIGWNVQTTWQYMDDPQVVKVLNEIDLISNESGLYGTVYGAFTETDFDSPVTLYNGAVQTGILGNTKLYLAGGNTRARYYSYRFYSNAPSLTTDEVLTTFTVEHCPISRI